MSWVRPNCCLLFITAVSNSLQHYGRQHARLPCPPLSPGVCSNSCPLSQWCHPTMSSSVVPFSSCPQSFPESQSFPATWLFTSDGQSIGTSASASVLPMNIQDWFPSRLIGLISLLFKGLSRVFSNTTVQKHQFFNAQPSLWSSSHIHTWLLEKPYLWLYKPLLVKWCLLFNTLPRFVIAFLPRSKVSFDFLVHSPSIVIFGAQEKKVC